jgi:hypothetical protein
MKDLNNATSTKMRPFVATTIYAVAMLIGCLLIAFPAILLIGDLPLEAWPQGYLNLLSAFAPIALTASAMALLFGFLTTSTVGRKTCAAIFGLSLPPVFLATISVSLLVIHGIEIHGFDEVDDLWSALVLYALFGGIGVCIYWSATRPPKM